MNEKIKYFFPKIKNRLSVEKSRIFEKIPVEKYSLRGIDDCGGKKGFIMRLNRILGGNVAHTIQQFAKVEDIKPVADRAYSHVFDLLGSGEIMMPSINWNKELKSGYEWPVGVFYTRLRALTPKGSDIKIPWELSRCHHLLWLGETFLITGEGKYAKEVVDEIADWIESNPLMYAVNWTCSMDVAIRAINWMYALLFIERSEYFDDAFASKVYQSLYQHLFFIKNNLEKCIPYSNNHYVSDLVGLLFLGAFFSTNAKGRKAFRFAKKEYINETLIEVLPSGVNYEKSVSYHRLMTELLVYSRCMLVRIGEKLPKSVDDRLQKMLEYVGHYSVNGSSPLVGDNDNGRLLPFISRNFKDHTYLVDDSSLEWRIVNSDIQPLAIHRRQFLYSQVFTDANVAILKKKSRYVFVGCSPRWRFDKATEQYVGTHLHNDLLSFVYFDSGKEIIVDPGVYCYTSDIDSRNEFRSAKKHNTIIVDGEEQNLLSASSAFGMKYNSHAKPLALSDGENSVCQGEYETIRGGMRHKRVFRLHDEGLEITDVVRKEGKGHDLYMSFHFAKNVEAFLDDNRVILQVGEERFCLCVESKTMLNLELVEDVVSPSYGIKENAKTLVVQGYFDGGIEMKTIITATNNGNKVVN